MLEQGIKGRGVDADPSQRPGVPMEQPPHVLSGAQVPIEPQKSIYPVLLHGGRRELPPVYGTAAPPKALSGLLRKAAYRYPDHWARHWMVLLFADRVDSWEHNWKKALPVATALFLGGLAVKQLRR